MTTPLTATPANPSHLPDRSQVMLSYPLTLATRGAIQTYNRTFRRVDAALYLAQIIVRVQGAASRQFTHEIDQVNTALDDELRRLEDTLATQRGWMTKRRAAAPAADAEGVIYTDPVTATLGLRTPKARRYVHLLTALDQALQHLDRAWYDDAIGDDERLDRSATLIRGFHRACGAIERLARGLAQRVRAEDGAAPNATYQAMLIKRTGRRAGEAPPDPPDTDAERPMMTATEAAGLEEMEQMAADLTAPAAIAEEPAASEALTAPTPEESAASEVLTAPADAPSKEPAGATDAAPEALTAAADALPEAAPEALGAAEAAILAALPDAISSAAASTPEMTEEDGLAEGQRETLELAADARETPESAAGNPSAPHLDEVAASAAEPPARRRLREALRPTLKTRATV